MLAQLGNIKFEGVRGFDSFEDTRASLFPTHPRLRGKATIEHTGEEPVALSIGVRFNVAFCSPESEIAALEAYRVAGEILPLVLGTGEVVGDFVITEIQKRIEEMTSIGQIIQAGLTLALLEHHDPDKLTTRQQSAINNAPAVQNGTLRPILAGEAARAADAEEAARRVQEAKVAASDVAAQAKAAQSFPDRIAYYATQAQAALAKVQAASAAAQAKINATQSLLAQLPNVPATLSALQNIAATCIAAFPVSSPQDLSNINAALQGAVSTLSRDTAGLSKIVALRKR